MTRIVGRQMLLGDVEKEHMRTLIRRVEGFTGVRVLTYALMNNHIHLLVEEPDRDAAVSDEMLMERLQALYTAEEMEEIEVRWADWMAQGNVDAVMADKLRYKRRMHDISEFMKSLKHRFSFWYNRMHARKGTLWEERFKSVLVEGGDVLRTVAAYIEINAVRGGLVNDPSEYRFCGFGEAMGGSQRARDGVMELMIQKGMAFGRKEGHHWKDLSARYFEEVLMYGQAKRDGQSLSMMDEARLQEELGERKVLSAQKRYHCRCRYFTDGQVLGGKDFVEAFFEENKDYFGPRRRTGGRKVRGDWDDLYSIRDVGQQQRKKKK